MLVLGEPCIQVSEFWVYIGVADRRSLSGSWKAIEDEASQFGPKENFYGCKVAVSINFPVERGAVFGRSALFWLVGLGLRTGFGRQ